MKGYYSCGILILSILIIIISILFQQGIVEYPFQKYGTKIDNISVGDVFFNYWKVKKIQDIPELRIKTFELYHMMSGSQYIHASALNDSNNFFSISFRTPIYNDTGLPHILEHLVLCGSERYPVKDPFFSMTRRSLNTFMNAWTAADHTSYLFSSQIERDYYNLMGMYLDAVYFPLLREKDFKQEGFRIEKVFSNNSSTENEKKDNDQHTSIKMQGVVYNEMKGVVFDPSNFMIYSLNKLLYEGTCYASNAGGDPTYIPYATIDAIRNFHRKFYSPSNTLFFSYGDLPFFNHLKVIQQFVFDEIEKRETISKRPLFEQDVGKALLSSANDVPTIIQSGAKNVNISGPADISTSEGDDLSRQFKYVIGFLTNSASELFETFTLQVINSLLLDDPRGVLYKSLISSGMAPDFIPFVGYENSDLLRNRTSFLIGVTGISEDRIPLIEETIIETLQNYTKHCANNDHQDSKDTNMKIRQEDIDAILNQMELSMKEITTHFGKGLMMHIVPYWVHGTSPIDALQFDRMIRQFRMLWKEDSCFIEKKIRKYLLLNENKVTMIIKPSSNFTDRIVEMEEKLKSKIPNDINEEHKEMDTPQQDGEHILPCLKIEDIPSDLGNLITGKNVEEFHPMINGHNVSVLFNKRTTNGIVYFTLVSVFSIYDIPPHLRPYVSIFSNILTNIGAGEMDHLSLSEIADIHTGGISAGTVIIPKLNSFEHDYVGLTISSNCIFRNVEKMLELVETIYTRPHLNNTGYIKTLIEQEWTSISESTTNYGHKYARSLSASFISEVEHISETFSGLSHMKLLKNIVHHESFSDSIQRLQELRKYLLKFKNLKLLVTFDENTNPLYLKDRIFAFLKNISEELINTELETAGTSDYEDFNIKNGTKHYVTLPFPVNFVSASIRTSPIQGVNGGWHHSHLEVTASLVSKFLHEEIREKGGAYGSFASISSSGIFSMTTYRDPHVLRSLDAFHAVIQRVCVGNFTDQDIRESILGAMQRIDAPIPPHQKINFKFLFGISEHMKKEYRKAVLGTRREDILYACHSFLQSQISRSSSNGGSSGSSPNFISSSAVLGAKDHVSSLGSSWEISHGI